ncbi:cyclic pyranopterin monophosphate synthase MoaC [Campylobacter sp. 19-13652]|uniref:cyclic pyranopterin monophosphate synthase MoaC n=1 Tax=Campylobacter sp. 19-13652 TaxID=2840180 RepID=UPI001C76309D|nr:cyclic pyranopterin monophosphate synthase MoaC [Campylobacter sp. 19-13652]BCX78715.1 cyclic pyranopterin monophosphate synthase accessory protein [Campylobacter sp. 19-13652]
MLTHIDKNNQPKMVDVSDKNITLRIARASGEIAMSKEAFDIVESGAGKKGPVLQTAVIAAIMAAKKTPELIPMCHPLLLSGVDCEIMPLENKIGYKLSVSVKIEGKTGVEMEALTAVSVGLLAIYDMVKAVDKSMQISNIKLDQKIGGKSGEYTRDK